MKRRRTKTVSVIRQLNKKIQRNMKSSLKKDIKEIVNCARGK